MRWRRLSRRQPAQAVALAAVGMIAMVGALSIVVDAGLFFIIERNMQAAADAGALAAVWYAPVCDVVDVSHAAGCQPGTTSTAAAIATSVAQANLGLAMGLCGGPENNPQIAVNINPHPAAALIHPHLNVYVVSIDCQARHWFTGIFPDLPLTKYISVSAAATIGWPSPNAPYDLLDSQVGPTHLAARLIGAPQ